MNYLELVQALADETGTEEADAITSVTSPDGGYQRKLATWIRRAHREIQQENENWRFRVATAEFDLTADQGEYDISAQLPNFQTVRPYNAPFGTRYALMDDNRSWPVRYMRWQAFAGYWESRTDTGRPRRFAVAPGDLLRVWPVPTQDYVLQFAYTLVPVDLEADADEPVLPEQYHDLIVFHAIINYAGYDEAQAQYQRASAQYRRLRLSMRRNELPEAVVSSPAPRFGWC